jgi:hypothetical protein
MKIHPSASNQVMNSNISTIESSSVHVIQSITPNGTQQLGGKNIKGKHKKEVETTMKIQNMMQMLEKTRRRRVRQNYLAIFVVNITLPINAQIWKRLNAC